MLFRSGDHGTTFGGGPLAAAVAHDVLSRIAEPDLLADVREKSRYFYERLLHVQEESPHVVAVRGKGLMLAIEIDVEPKDLIAACAENGLLICKTGGPAVRFLPPLNVTAAQIDECVHKLTLALQLM